jgi:hypothetical protein
MEKQVRTHRVGAITAGLSMVVFGVLFILHLFIGSLDYVLIFRLWPIMLIGLGVELLISNYKSDQVIYDKPAVVLLFITTLFAMSMAGADMLLQIVKDGLIH